MATTVTTLRADIITRLLIGSTTQEPTTTMIDGWIRQGFKQAIASLNPIFKSSALTVAAANTVSLTHSDLYFVTSGPRWLIPGVEWSPGVNIIYLHEPAAIEDDVVVAYYFAAPDLTGATIETSCVLGTDWLEELAATYTMLQCESRLFNTAGSNDSAGHAQMYRVLQDQYASQLQALATQRNEWLNKHQGFVDARRMQGNLPARENPVAGFLNQSMIVNPLTGHVSR